MAQVKVRVTLPSQKVHEAFTVRRQKFNRTRPENAYSGLYVSLVPDRRDTWLMRDLGNAGVQLQKVQEKRLRYVTNVTSIVHHHTYKEDSAWVGTFTLLDTFLV